MLCEVGGYVMKGLLEAIDSFSRTLWELLCFRDPYTIITRVFGLIIHLMIIDITLTKLNNRVSVYPILDTIAAVFILLISGVSICGLIYYLIKDNPGRKK
jgi:uncharacterized protein YacL